MKKVEQLMLQKPNLSTILKDLPAFRYHLLANSKINQLSAGDRLRKLEASYGVAHVSDKPIESIAGLSNH